MQIPKMRCHNLLVDFGLSNPYQQSDLRPTEVTLGLKKEAFLDRVQSIVVELVKSNSYGLLAQMSNELVVSKGKMLRPQFVRELSVCLQVNLSDSVSWAACCELLHSATLIHDDLQDGDTVRRGQPTTWVKYGANQAVNAGDFFLMLAPQAVLTSHLQAEIKTDLLMLLSQISTQIAAGQAEEIELRGSLPERDLMARYFECIGGKTSRLFSGLARGVAILAGLGVQQADQVESVFFDLGQVFQVQDDILDLYGDKLRGECGCDIKEGKVSFLVASHISQHPEDREMICEILKKPRGLTTREDIEAIKKIMGEKSTLASAVKFVQSQSTELLNHPLLLANLKLKGLVRGALVSILEPISHLSFEELPE